MDFWFILLASGMAAGLVVAAVLLWVGINAMLYGRGLRRQAAITIAGLGRLLRMVYDDTVDESLPDDHLDLLGQLARHRPAQAESKGSGRLALS